MSNKCDVMHKDYPAFLRFMKKCEVRKSAQTLESCFEVWLKVNENWRELHNEQAFLLQQRQELPQIIIDYCIYSAILTLETYCRYRHCGQAFQVMTEDRETNEPVKQAWRILELLGVETKEVGIYGNRVIIYDKSKNPFFGRA